MSQLGVVEPRINGKRQSDNTKVTQLLRAEMHMKCRNLIPSWEREQRYFVSSPIYPNSPQSTK